MTNLYRKGEGQPLRDAMRRVGLTQAQLAAKTRAVDVQGKGVSAHTVSNVTGTGKTATESCRLRTAWLVATALGEPLQDHFSLPGDHTHTVGR